MGGGLYCCDMVVWVGGGGDSGCHCQHEMRRKDEQYKPTVNRAGVPSSTCSC